MLCPVHKSTKFPSEKSHSKKQKHGEHYSASARMYEAFHDYLFIHNFFLSIGINNRYQI